ncbi:unnamed protein product [Acanthosepion pharaonis]|uniref:Uncharacterized protein n=1 Tax=Acanthosepion pharaonis TaxID=158019 RepID=A0A812ERW9_ACAPH|nr:unnamed protein product [Sepia pharaonis]
MSSLLFPSSVRHSSLFLNDFPANLRRDDFFNLSYPTFFVMISFIIPLLSKRLCIFLSCDEYFCFSFFKMSSLLFPSSPTFFVITSIVIPMLSKHLCIFFPWDDYFCFSFIKMSSLLFPSSMSSLLFPSSVRHSSLFLNNFPANLLLVIPILSKRLCLSFLGLTTFVFPSSRCLLYSFLPRKRLCLSFLGLTTFVFPSSRCLLYSFLRRYDILLFF